MDRTTPASPDYWPPDPHGSPLAGLLDPQQYQLVRELGRGGMGVVYLARNVPMDRLEVLKVVAGDLLGKPEAVERFAREIRAAAKLSHPNVVTAYTVLRPGGLLVLAMEYVPGENLADVVKARGPLPVRDACYYAYQAALGLQHAHERGMVHRDIKPHNLMLLKDGRKRTVKILDFGLAKAAGGSGTGERGLTHSGAAMGTPDYIAPEQSEDAASADTRADVYSLGCTLYHLLTGKPPFDAPSLLGLLLAHRDRTPVPLDVIRPAVPVELAEVAAKMLAKQPADRYQTPGEVAAALKPFVTGEGTSIEMPVARIEMVPPVATQTDAESVIEAEPVPDSPAAAPPPQPAAKPDSWCRSWVGSVSKKLPQVKSAARPIPSKPRWKKKPRRKSVTSISKIAVASAASLSALTLIAFVVLPRLGGSRTGMPVSRETEPAVSGVVVSGEPQTPAPGNGPTWVSKATGMRFARIPAGTFMMGSPDSDTDRSRDETPHEVALTRDFYMGVHEVTVGQFRAFVTDTGYEADKESRWRTPGFPQTDDHPVVCVSWTDAVAFAEWLTEKDGVKKHGQLYRLPTEAEWEYSCRGGAISKYQKYHFGDDPADLRQYGNIGGTGVFTTPVGKLKPNPFGLYDMHGNVWEWCRDWYADYLTDRVENPKGPPTGSHRVRRGGGWYSDPGYCRSAYRDSTDPSVRNSYLGFRLSLVPSGR